MATNYFINKTAVATDTNGGTSLAVRSTGVDGIVNTTAGTTKITSVSAAGTWSAADVGHGIFASNGSKFRLISAFTAGTTLSVTTSSGSATVVSSAGFSAGMVGQAITGPGIAANTVLTAFTDSSHMTMSANAGVGFGTGTGTLYPMFTTTGNVAFTAATGQTWNVGGPWATVNGSAFATNGPCSGGDTIYVAPGIYREAVTANLTSPTTALSIIGDVTGSNNGVLGGEVRISAFNSGDNTGAGTHTASTKNFLQFSNIVFHGAWTGLGGHDCSFVDCAVIQGGFTVTVTVDIANNLLIDRCIVWQTAGNVACIALTFPTSTVADYDAAITVRNSLLWQMVGGTAVTAAGSGANTFKGNGATFRSCTVIGSFSYAASGTTLSTSFPIKIYDNALLGNSTYFTAGAAGQMIEDYNWLASSGGRSNVTAGVHSGPSNAGVRIPYSVGQERIWGGSPRFTFTPHDDTGANIFGWGAIASPAGPSVDGLNRNRPAGIGRLMASGQATAGAATTLTDSAANFTPNSTLVGAVCAITGGTGSGQAKMIKSHTNTVLTFYGNWQTNPDSTSTYVIYFGAPTDCGTATAGGATTLTQSSATWVTNVWTGFIVEITAGTGNGQTNTITSNSGSALTVPTWGTNPDATSKFKIYRQTSESTVNPTAGWAEGHDFAQRETVVVDGGSVGWSLPGYQDQELYIPVDTTSTTITIRGRYDSAHAATNKPQVTLLADAELGVSTQTVAMTVAANTWETVSLSAFTPTAAGFVVLRLQSRSAVPYGRAFFDTVTVT